MSQHRDGGFTLIEILVAISLFSIVTVVFYQVMFSQIRGSDTARAVARVSEEARAGLNRMIRDTREADQLVAASPTSYDIRIDFNENGSFNDQYEYVRYAYHGNAEPVSLVDGNAVDIPADSITIAALNAGGQVTEIEVLAGGVKPTRSAPDTGASVIFDYSSNYLKCDAAPGSYPNPGTANGVAEWQELDKPNASCVSLGGNGDGQLNGAEVDYISNVDYAFAVESEGRRARFVAQAQLRNQRWVE